MSIMHMSYECSCTAGMACCRISALQVFDELNSRLHCCAQEHVICVQGIAVLFVLGLSRRATPTQTMLHTASRALRSPPLAFCIVNFMVVICLHA